MNLPSPENGLLGLRLLSPSLSQVLFKMDKEGNGQEIDRRNLGANEVLPFENWTDDMVRQFVSQREGHFYGRHEQERWGGSSGR